MTLGKRIYTGGFYTPLDQRPGFTFVKEFEGQKIFLNADGHFVCHQQDQAGAWHELKRTQLAALERDLTPRTVAPVACISSHSIEGRPFKVGVASYDRRNGYFRDVDGSRIFGSLFLYDEAVYGELQALHEEYRQLADRFRVARERLTFLTREHIAAAQNAPAPAEATTDA